jgi:hypothetical protein
MVANGGGDLVHTVLLILGEAQHIEGILQQAEQNMYTESTYIFTTFQNQLFWHGKL